MKDLNLYGDFMRRDLDVCGAIKHITALVEDNNLSIESTRNALNYINEYIVLSLKSLDRDEVKWRVQKNEEEIY